MSDFLPQDLLVQIFRRLPIRSLIRCTSVCKTWYNFITSPSFISTHLSHNLAKLYNNGGNARIFLRRFSKDGPEKGLEDPDDGGGNLEFPGYKAHYSLHRDNEDFDEYANFDDNFAFVARHWYFRIIGCCNGLVCMADDEFTFFGLTDDESRHCTVIWNPSINRWVCLPRPIFSVRTHGPYEHALGFGFDAFKNDYKVVRVVYLESNEIPAKVEIYRLSCGIWEDISHVELRNVVCGKCKQACVNGVVYWVGKERDKRWGYRYFLVSFDMSGELFGQMELPYDAATDCYLSSRDLLVSNDSLYLIHWIYDEWSNVTFNVWVLKEYGVAESWSKQFHVSTSCLGVPLSFRQNGEILWVLGKALVSYDPKSKRVKNLGLTGYTWSLHWRSFHAETYVESLVLLDRKMDYKDSNPCIVGSNVKCNPENHEIASNIIEEQKEEQG